MVMLIHFYDDSGEADKDRSIDIYLTESTGIIVQAHPVYG